MHNFLLFFYAFHTVNISYLQYYEDVIKKRYGEIHKIWMTPGHIFITVKEGRQLFTFDNKSASRTIVCKLKLNSMNKFLEFAEIASE